MASRRINYKELNVLREFSPIIKIRMRHIVKKKCKRKTGILIVNTGIIGDFLATLPAMNAFLEKNSSTADIIVSPPLKTLAGNIKGIKRVFIAKSSYLRDIERMGKEKIGETLPDKEYDTLVIFRTSEDAYKLIREIKYSKLIHNDAAFMRWMGYVMWHIPRKKEIKQWRDVNYEIVNMKRPQKPVSFKQIFHFTKEDYAKIDRIPEMHGKEKKILIHTGSGWIAKLWEDKKWIEVIKKIHATGKFKFIFIGGDETEQKSFDNIQSKLDFKVFSLIKKVDLKDLLLIMRRSDYFIGIDSGPRNLAHLADLRSVCIFGPAALRNFMPTSNKDIVIDKYDSISTHWFYLGGDVMEKITSDEVFNAFIKLKNNNTKSSNRK